MKLAKRVSVGMVMLLTLCLARPAQAQTIPNVMNFQSVLFDDDGNLISDSSADILFRIVDLNGNEVYAEEQPAVTIIDGMINVLIGTGIVPGSNPAEPTGGLALVDLQPDSALFVEVTVGTITTLEPMELVSVPYSFFAEQALSIASGSVSFSQLVGQVTTLQLPAADQLITYITTPDGGGNIPLSSDAVSTIGPFANSTGSVVEAVLLDLDNGISALVVDDTTQDGRLNGHDTRLNTAETDINAVESDIITAENDITSHNSRIGTLEGDVADHEGRITALEGNPIDEAGILDRLRPHAYGTATFPCSGAGASITAPYNASVGNGFRVNFATAVATPYVVLLSGGGDGGEARVTSRNNSGFDVDPGVINCVGGTQPAVIDFLVFKN